MDLDRIIGATSREVIGREHNGAMARVIIARRNFSTDIEDLWNALTDPERIPRWFLPISGDLVLGGHYQFEGNAGGEITDCERPEHLGVTWGMHGQTSWVHIRLSAVSEQETELCLEHTAHVPEDFWAQYGPGAVGIGWEQGLLGLELHLAGDTSIDPETSLQWTLSAEGRAFVAGSSDGWCQAAIAHGMPEAAARAAAESCVNFYTPPES